MSYKRIPDEAIEAVLKHHDLVELVGRYVHLTKQGRYMKGLCPFHSEKTPSFTVTPEKQIFYCYGCHAGGNAIHFLMGMEGYSFVEAVQELAKEAGISLGWQPAAAEKTKEQKEREMQLEAYELAAKFYRHILLHTEQGKPARQYLQSRGISDKWIEFFGLGCAPPLRDALARFLDKRNFPLPLMEKAGLLSEGPNGYFDKFRDRVLFPIADAKGRVVAFAGRALGDVQPKYLNSPESALFNKRRTLFNLHNSRSAIRKTKQAVLFEGYLDVIRAWEAGVDNGVATMGTALTDEHAALLRRFADQVVICYDGDAAGQSAAFKAIRILEQAGLLVKVAMLPAGVDPDEYIAANGPERFRLDVIEAAIPALQYKLYFTQRNFNMQDVDDRLRYIDLAVGMIAELESPVEREHYVKELANQFPAYSLEAIKQQLNETRQMLLKKRRIRDKNENRWNNGWNNGNEHHAEPPALLPAHHNAEIQLLYWMMHDRETAEYVQHHLGDRFNIEAHAALAAYLYAFYAQGNEPDPRRLMAALQDPALESAAVKILMQEIGLEANPEAIDDCIREILKAPLLREIEQKRENMIRAERAGDVLTAAQIASEIISLEKRLKAE